MTSMAKAVPPTAAQLSIEHDELEQWFTDLAQRAATGEPRECDAVWNDFTQQLENHLAFEEREIFPRYEKQGSVQAALVARFRQEHASIRQQLESLGVDLQLHLARVERIGAFLVALREHARRERESLYPWLATAPVT